MRGWPTGDHVLEPDRGSGCGVPQPTLQRPRHGHQLGTPERLYMGCEKEPAVGADDADQRLPKLAAHGGGGIGLAGHKKGHWVCSPVAFFGSCCRELQSCNACRYNGPATTLPGYGIARLRELVAANTRALEVVAACCGDLPPWKVSDQPLTTCGVYCSRGAVIHNTANRGGSLGLNLIPGNANTATRPPCQPARVRKEQSRWLQRNTRHPTPAKAKPNRPSPLAGGISAWYFLLRNILQNVCPLVLL